MLLGREETDRLVLSKAASAISVSPLGSDAVSKLELYANAWCPIEVTVFLNVKLAMFGQLENAYSPMVVTELGRAEMLTFVPLNAYAPIDEDVYPVGSALIDMPAPSKACSPIDVMLLLRDVMFVPEHPRKHESVISVTPLGIAVIAKDVQLANAHIPMEVSPLGKEENVTAVSANAWCPIVVNVDGRELNARFVHPENVVSGIAVIPE